MLVPYPIDSRALRPAAAAFRSVVLLWMLGLLATIVYYVAFARPFPLVERYRVLFGWGDLTRFDRATGFTYLVAMVVLAALFAVAAWAVLKVPYRVARWPIYGGALVAGLVLMTMYPGGSIDVFVYAAFSRVWVHFDANPLLVPAASFANDPITPLAAGWAKIPSPYGPLWTILSAFPSLFGKADVLKLVLLFKAMAFGFHLGGIALVSWILGRLAPRRRSLGTLLFAWNPAILFETIGNGHNDGAMMFFVLAAVAFSIAESERRRLVAPAALVLACLVKYTAALLLPLLLLYQLGTLPTWRARARFVALSGAIAAVVGVMLFAPFWEGPQTLDAARFQNTLIIATPVWLMNDLIKRSVPELAGRDLPQKALFAAFALVYLWQLGRVIRRPGNWLSVAFVSVLLSLYVVGKFYPWYGVWPLALAALIPSTRLLGWIVSFTLGVLLWAFFMDFGFQWTAKQPADLFRANLYVVVLAFVVPALVQSVTWLRDRRRRRPEAGRESEEGLPSEPVGRAA